MPQKQLKIQALTLLVSKIAWVDIEIFSLKRQRCAILTYLGAPLWAKR
jgi:hypothetical protein